MAHCFLEKTLKHVGQCFAQDAHNLVSQERLGDDMLLHSRFVLSQLPIFGGGSIGYMLAPSGRTGFRGTQRWKIFPAFLRRHGLQTSLEFLSVVRCVFVNVLVLVLVISLAISLMIVFMNDLVLVISLLILLVILFLSRFMFCK